MHISHLWGDLSLRQAVKQTKRRQRVLFFLDEVRVHEFRNGDCRFAKCTGFFRCLPQHPVKLLMLNLHRARYLELHGDLLLLGYYVADYAAQRWCSAAPLLRRRLQRIVGRHKLRAGGGKYAQTDNGTPREQRHEKEALPEASKQ